MSQVRIERPLIPRQPECNIGTSGHVDHGKCLRWDQYVLLNGVPVTGADIMSIVAQTGSLVARIDGGEVYEFNQNVVVSMNEKLEPVMTGSLFYVEQYSGPIYTIKSRTGRSLSVTPGHPLLVNRNGSLTWVKAKDLNQGDHIAFLSRVPLIETVDFPDPEPSLERHYEIITWEEYQQLRAETSGFENFAGLDLKQFEKVRILGGLSKTELCRRAKMDGGTYRRLILDERVPAPKIREKLISTLRSTKPRHLSPGEFIIVQRTGHTRRIRKLKEIELGSDLVKWFAFVWSKGSSGTAFIDITQTVQLEMLQEYLHITKQEFGVDFAKYPNGRYRIYNKPFVDYLRFKFHFSPGNKANSPIASWVCRLPKSLKATFLRWFLTLDGEFDQHSGQIMVAQANERNIVMISYLLHSFGIVPRFGKLQRNTKKGPKEYFRLLVSGRRNLQTFAELIGFASPEIQASLMAYLGGIKKASKETNLSIPLDASSLQILCREIGLRRESFQMTKGVPTMKGTSWYKAYESAIGTGRISRSKLLLVVQSIDEHLGRVEVSLSLLHSMSTQLRKHMELVGISLERAASELGMSRKKLTRILKNEHKDELTPLAEFLRSRTEEIIRNAQSKVEQLRLLSRTTLEFDRIISAEVQQYRGFVFDLTVPEYANFVGGPGAIICHNTSIVQAITGVWASAHSEELRRGITIKVGYADAAFYKCPDQDPPSCYSTSPKCPIDGKSTKLLRAVSFVDAPGHESLMTNMLAGAFLMDGALLVIAANEPVPRPQTREHLQALQLLGMKKIVVVQNKIDLVTNEEARMNHDAIERFVANTVAGEGPIIPVSAQQRINIDALIEAIEEVVPTPRRDPAKDALMYVVRSFDVNKPGIDISDLNGGVLGGSLTKGELNVGDEIEMRPGMPDERSGKYVTLNTKVRSLGTGAGITNKVGPGGLVAVGTGLDPAFTKNDQMVGSVIGKPGSLPPVWEHVTLDHELFESVVGSAEPVRVEKIRVGEGLRLNLGTASTLANATSVRERVVELELKKPVCMGEGARAAISRRIADRWRLIGSGVLK